jgi:hypothetical protein
VSTRVRIGNGMEPWRRSKAYMLRNSQTSRQFRNGGVAVLDTNRIYGGDSGNYYVGNFSVKDGTITATANVVRHNMQIPSIWGDNSPGFSLTMQGTVHDGVMQGWMERVGTPGRRLPIRLTWKVALP